VLEPVSSRHSSRRRTPGPGTSARARIKLDIDRTTGNVDPLLGNFSEHLGRMTLAARDDNGQLTSRRDAVTHGIE
jgi:hypothetical protein